MNTKNNGKNESRRGGSLLAVADTAYSVFRNRRLMLGTRVSNAQGVRDSTSEEPAKGNSSVLTAVGILLVAVAASAVLVGIVIDPSGAPPPNPEATTNTSQSPGEVRITVVDPGNANSLILVGPDGTRSSVFSSGFQPGAEITMRSNSTAHGYLENNSVKIPAGGGFVTIDTPSDVTTTQLSFQEADLSDTDYTPHTAYLACLYEPEGFELDWESVPPNITIPCHSPVLAQTDNIQTPTSTERNGDTVTTPIILKEGRYNLIGSLNGREGVVQSIEVSEGIASQ